MIRVGWALAVCAVASASCALDWESVRACEIADDCAWGWACVDGACVEAPYPQLGADEARTREQRPVEIDLFGNDVAAFPLEIEAIEGVEAGASVEVIGPGVVRYHPSQAFVRQSFSYRINRSGSSRGNVYIDVHPNDPPVPMSDARAVTWNEGTAISLLAEDVDGDPLDYRIVEPPAHGTLRGEPPALIYEPEPGFLGEDRFTFTAADDLVEAEEPAEVVLSVFCATADDEHAETDWATPVAIDVLDGDAFGPGAEVVAFTQPANGAAAVLDDGRLQVSAEPRFVGELSLIYTAGTADGCRAGGEVRVDVNVPIEPAPGLSRAPAPSGDGRYVAFVSDAPLDAADANGVADVYVWDRETGALERASVAAGGAGADGPSGQPHVSADGRYVAFVSTATNLTAGQESGVADVYLRDRQAETTELVSVPAGGGEADFESSSPRVSDDGRFVVFASVATNLVAGDANGVRDVFLRDRDAGTTERVNVSDAGDPADAASGERAWMSGDASRIVFTSNAVNLGGDGDLQLDTFLRDRDAGTTILLGADSDAGAISPSGRHVAYATGSSVRVHDLAAGTTETVGFAATEEQFSVTDAGALIYLSSVGQVVAHELATGEQAALCVDRAGSDPGPPRCRAPAVSADGRFVAFDSEVALVPEVSSGSRVYVTRNPFGP